MDVKRCGKCGQVKPVSEFYKDCREKSGLRSPCKECHRLYHEAHREEKAVYNRLYRAGHCAEHAMDARRYGERHPERVAACKRRWQEAHPEKTVVSRRRWREAHRDEAHRERANACQRRYRETHPERIVEQCRRWNKNNSDKALATKQRRRALKVNAFGTEYTTAQMIEARREYYGNRCYLCSKPADAMDHVKPLSKGGAHLPGNLRPICKGCNSAKGGKWPYVKENGRSCDQAGNCGRFA